MKTLALTVAALLSMSVVANAQFGDLKNAKDKVEKTADKISIGGGKNSDNKTGGSGSSSEDVGSESATTISVSADDMKPGSGYFYTSFKPNGFKTMVSVGDELFVRMNLGKTMVELAADNGLESSFYAYGFIVAYIDGEKVFTAGPYSFASNISKQWTYIDIPLNVNPDFAEKLAADNSLLETNQDVWVFQHLYQEKNVPGMYAAAAIGKMKTGDHELKIEFALANSGDSEPKATVCSSTVKVGVDEAGSNAIAMNGPKHLRPLKEEEKGKIIFNTATFVPGMSELNFKLELPKPPKYYNEKWCKATSCDYDHGSLYFYASIDGKALANWPAELWDDNYEVKKNFDMILVPLTDAEIEDVEAPFNSSLLNKGSNPLTYALLDMFYGEQLKPGNHTLSIKLYSVECIPYESSYEFTDSYFAQWPSIAIASVDINVTTDGLTKLANSSSAKKLSHAGGEWVAKDAQLKSIYAGRSEFEVLDVAVQTEWKINTNYLGVILSRECKADVLYKCEYGCRIARGMVVVEEYAGGGNYGKPSYSVLFSDTPAMLNEWHFPVPYSKVK